MNISENFTLEEFTHSEAAARLGLDNTPGPIVTAYLKKTALLMEQVRTLLGKPIIVHSGYRSPQVNKAVGGVATSAHCRGLACDFVCPQFGSPADVAREIQRDKYNFDFDQCILEYGWVHLALGPPEVPWRQEFLTKKSASSPYEKGICA